MCSTWLSIYLFDLNIFCFHFFAKRRRGIVVAFVGAFCVSPSQTYLYVCKYHRTQFIYIACEFVLLPFFPFFYVVCLPLSALSFSIYTSISCDMCVSAGFGWFLRKKGAFFRVFVFWTEIFLLFRHSIQLSNWTVSRTILSQWNKTIDLCVFSFFVANAHASISPLSCETRKKKATRNFFASKVLCFFIDSFLNLRTMSLSSPLLPSSFFFSQKYF